MLGMTRNNLLMDVGRLKAWLEPIAAPESPEFEADLTFLIGADVDALPAASRSTMPFVLAVLRDIYPDDSGVLHWLTRDRADRPRTSALDLLTAGRLKEVERLLVRDWNRSRKTDVRHVAYVRREFHRCR